MRGIKRFNGSKIFSLEAISLKNSLEKTSELNSLGQKFTGKLISFSINSLVAEPIAAIFKCGAKWKK